MNLKRRSKDAAQTVCHVAHPPLRPGVFIQRLNRFAALVEVDGQAVLAHVPNSGRLRELLVAGRTVWLAAGAGASRRTGYDLRLVEGPGGPVCVDARVPNQLAARAVAVGGVPELAGWQVRRHEAVWGSSRFDLLLARDEQRCWLEAKSVTLVVDGQARFPDAPTSRGARHLVELAAARTQGFEAAVWFFVQREDAASFGPNETADPVFASALREAAAAGVRVLAYRCRVDLERIELLGAVPVALRG